MKQTISRIILATIAVAALFALPSCTPSNTSNAGTGGFYGPSTDNTSNYTDQMRSEYSTWR